MKLGQNFVKYFVCFLPYGVSRNIAFEINCPLVQKHGGNNFCTFHHFEEIAEIISDSKDFLKPLGCDL